MEKKNAIEQFLIFKSETGISRDKSIEVYGHFKLNPTSTKYTTYVNGDVVCIEREEFWDIINTSIIKELYKKPKEQSEIEISDDDATSTDYTKLRRETLRYKNKLNFERKAFNKKLTEINNLEELLSELVDGVNSIKPALVEPERTINERPLSRDVLLVQLSDIHAGEITEEFRGTGYDFEILSKRLKKFADKIKEEIVQKNIQKVVIFSTGDLVNSDSILSKRINQTCNKATSIIMMVKLLQMFILDIYQVCKHINFGAVSANEGRFDKDYFEDESLISNSPDFIILNMLELCFKDYDEIRFLEGRNNEQVVCVNGQPILFTHGVCLGKGDVEKGVMQIMSRYASKQCALRYVVFGHIHTARNSSLFMRGGSMVGDNAYSSTTLNLQSRASQNIAFVGSDGDINPLAVDLENVHNVNGYDISNEMRKFNLKRAQKKELNDYVWTVY